MKIKTGMVMTEVGGDYVAVPTGATAREFRGIVRLNDTGAEIWKGIEAGLTIDQIADKLVAEYDGLDKEHALRSVNTLVDSLRTDGLIVE